MEKNSKLKVNPFKVPENYFQELPSRIQERLKSPQPRLALFARPQIRLAFSVFIFVMISVAIVWNFHLSSSTGQDLLVDVPQEEIELYLASLAIDNDEILTFLDDDDLHFDDDYLREFRIENELDSGAGN